MIVLHQTRTPSGEVQIILDKTDGSVSYRKAGVTQTVMDSRGQNLAPHVDKTVGLFARENARRVLVLGHGGGMAARLLHEAGVEVISVDQDPCAEPLGRLFFRAPATLKVVIDDAASYAAGATAKHFDGVFVDFQEADAAPPAYLDPAFWAHLKRAMRPGGLLVLAVPKVLHAGRSWNDVRGTLDPPRMDSAALSSELALGWRLLVTVAD